VTGPPDLNHFTAELAELSRAFGAAGASLREPAAGTDATGSVTVSLDSDGRVADVRPTPRWRDQLSTDQLGDAVVEAAQAAAINRLDAWSQALDAQPEPGATPAQAPTPTVDLAALRADAPYLDLIGMLDEVTATLGQAVAASRAPVAPPAAPAVAVDDDDADLSYGSRPVVVRLDASGAVEHVDIELRWLAGADRARVGDTLTAAFARAYELHDAPLTAAHTALPDGQPPMSPQLAELIRNPAAALAAFAAQL
jgi:DNA-binding protein YbaB